jgi:hypothetical protein
MNNNTMKLLYFTLGAWFMIIVFLLGAFTNL